MYFPLRNRDIKSKTPNQTPTGLINDYMPVSPVARCLLLELCWPRGLLNQGSDLMEMTQVPQGPIT